MPDDGKGRSGPLLKVMLDLGNAGAHTGTGVYGRTLFASLQQYCNDAIDVREAGISSVSTRMRPLRRLLYLARLARLRRSGYRGADVVHFANVYAPVRKNGVAYVATIHDLDAILYPHLYTRRYSVYYGRTVAASTQRAHIVLTDTEAIRGQLLDRYPIGEERVKVVGIGVSPQFVKAVEAAGRITDDHPLTMLFVGRLEAKKNVEWLVDSVAMGVRSGAIPKLRLQLAGGNSYGFPAIQRALREAGPIAEWIATPDMQRLATLYTQSDLVVLPSHCEGFGIPLLEAMYCGKPIVASRIPTSVEVTGGGAYFFDLGRRDAFYAAVNDCVQGKSRRMHDAIAAQQLAHYAWPVLARAAAHVYTEAGLLA